MNLGEADKLVTFFSLDRGRLRGVAKNARKSFRRFGAGLELFTHARLHLYEKEHQELIRIESADIISQHFESEDPEWAFQFQQELEQGGHSPEWSFEDLQEAIPETDLRRQMVAEIRSRRLSFFTEPIPVFAGWPDAPCVYIRLSAPYDRPALQARRSGWITHTLQAGHFHMLVDAKAMTDLLVDSVDSIGRGSV